MTAQGAREQMSLPLRTSAGFEMAPTEVTMSDPVRITVSPPGHENVVGEGPDLMSALRHARLQLEEHDLLLWVNGARRNVHASGMQRQMAQGRFAYVLPPQRGSERPMSTDVLEAPPPDADVVSVSEQDAWFEVWSGAPGAASGRAPVPTARSTQAPSKLPRRRPSTQAAEAARSQPGGWVYEIEGPYGPQDAVPPEAIRGAWRVDEQGLVVGDFVENPRFVEPGTERGGRAAEPPPD